MPCMVFFFSIFLVIVFVWILLVVMSQDIASDDLDIKNGWVPSSQNTPKLKKNHPSNSRQTTEVHRFSSSGESSLSSDTEDDREIKRFKRETDNDANILSALELRRSREESAIVGSEVPAANISGVGSSWVLDGLNKITNFTVERLSADDEFWLMQCPAEVTEDALRKQSISFGKNGTCTLEQSLNGGCQLNVKVSTSSEKTFFSCLLPSENESCFKPVVFPFAGHITVTESFRDCQLLEEGSTKPVIIPRKEVLSLPDNLKLRHPLLGLSQKDSRKLRRREKARLSS